MRAALLLWALAAAAPVIQVGAPPKAELGSPLTVRAALEVPAGEQVELEVVRSTSAFALIGVTERPAAAGREFLIGLVPLDLGRQGVNLVWTYRENGGQPQSVSTPVVIEVQEPESVKQEGQARDIKPPLGARARWWPWLLALLCAGGAWAAWSRLRRPALAPEAAAQGRLAPRTAEERAARALDELEASGLWAAGRRGEFYLRLTEVLRAYLEERYGFAATRLTTAETLRRLRALDLDRAATAAFRSLFERADLVKFAKLGAEEGWGASDLTAARGFVAACAPRKEAPAP